MITYFYAGLLVLIALFFLHAEKKTRGPGSWYTDRALLFTSGALIGAALAISILQILS